ncbi:hypothetical protein Ancab_029393 [Ancistrocladus abbreviatus]
MFDGGISMSFPTLKYPSHFLGKICYKPGAQCGGRLLVPPLAATPTSVLLQTSESDNSPDSNRSSVANSNIDLASSASDSSMLDQANGVVGILGGVSVNSTVSFLQKLVHWSSKDGKDCPPFVLCSESPLKKEILFHGNPFPSVSCRNETARVDLTPTVANLGHRRAFLEQGGARCIVMPCNVLHSWHDEISKGCSVPFLHMGECVVKELKEAKLKPLEAGSPLRIGLLATNATVTSGFYQEKLQNEGFEVVLPDKATVEHTILPALEALDKNDIKGAQNLIRIALQVLLVRAVNTVIVASDELRDLLPSDDPLLRKCTDPIDALVRATIGWVRAAEECT